MSNINPPPRLLIGATLLFWGAISGRPFIGLLMALVAESSQWLKWRWDFDDAAIAKAWQLALILSVGLLVLMLVDGEREQLMPMLIGWFPALVLPLYLAQMFGLRDSIPLSALSFFAASRRERNKRLGLEEHEVKIHFGNAYFVVILFSSALGIWAEAKLFLPGLLILCAWRFLARPGRRVTAIVAVFICAGMIAVLGQTTLNRVYDWFSRGGHPGANWLSDATHGFTAIGSMRDMKLSNEIRWRIRAEEGQRPPLLLRRASFNRYRGTNWEITPSPQGGGADGQFNDLEIIEPVIGKPHYLPNPQIDSESAISNDLASFSMRGSTRSGGAMPLPGNVASFDGFDLDSAQRNLLSTVRIFPASPIIDGRVLWQAEHETDGEPIWADDLRMPPLEAEVIKRVADSIGLREEMTTREKLRLLHNWFRREFSYTLYLSVGQPKHGLSEGTAIGRFLESTRSGHCEYFATAAALLLRAGDVPTRYTTGYAVVERDPRRNKYTIRGIHGHAWCRVWIGEESRWVDFDPTPGDWQTLEELDKISWTQRIYDAFKRFREDLFIWRSDPKNRELLVMIITVPGVLGGFWIAWRLWKSRHRSHGSSTHQSANQGSPSPLFSLESLATRHLGPRPEGLPYAKWLDALSQHLGDAGHSLKEAIRLHQEIRFDPGTDPAGKTTRLHVVTRQLRDAIRLIARCK